jgi:hypothetical protein
MAIRGRRVAWQAAISGMYRDTWATVKTACGRKGQSTALSCGCPNLGRAPFSPRRYLPSLPTDQPGEMVRMGLLNAAYTKLVEVIRALQAADEEFLEGDAGD